VDGAVGGVAARSDYFPCADAPWIGRGKSCAVPYDI